MWMAHNIGKNLRQVHPNATYTTYMGLWSLLKGYGHQPTWVSTWNKGMQNIMNPIPHRKLILSLWTRASMGRYLGCKFMLLLRWLILSWSKAGPSKTQFTRSLISCSDPRIIATSFQVYILLRRFFTFNVCNCSGVAYTKPWVVDHPLVLFCIIAGLIFGHPSVIGYNEIFNVVLMAKLTWSG